MASIKLASSPGLCGVAVNVPSPYHGHPRSGYDYVHLETVPSRGVERSRVYFRPKGRDTPRADDSGENRAAIDSDPLTLVERADIKTYEYGCREGNYAMVAVSR